MTLKYEIAVFNEDKEVVQIYEYTTLNEMLNALTYIIDRFYEFEYIELATQHQEDDENINTYVWATIDIKEYCKGEYVYR